jgi:hypothetical protein
MTPGAPVKILRPERLLTSHSAMLLDGAPSIGVFIRTVLANLLHRPGFRDGQHRMRRESEPVECTGAGGILSRTVRWHGLAVLAAAVCARLVFFDPSTTTMAWHAADYGSIARNYYRHGFHLFYPQIDWGGDGPGYVEMEFPIVPFITALGYALLGFDERFAAIAPFVFGVAGVLLTYALARELFGPSVALFAGLVAAVSPAYARYSQLFFPESLLLASSVLSVYSIVRWCRTERVFYWYVAAASASLAILIKPTALVLGAPILWLFWLKNGQRFLRQPRLWLFGVLVLAPVIAWYWHALILAQQYGNSFGILFGGGSNKLANRELLLMGEFYGRLASRMVLYHLTPIGIAGVAAALLAVPFSPEQRAVTIWFWAVIASFFVAAVGNDAVPYYQLPIIPPASVLAGAGLVWFVRSATSRWFVRKPAFVTVTVVAALAVGAVTGMVVHHQRADYVKWFRVWHRDDIAVGRLLRPDALIIFSEVNAGGNRQPIPRGRHVTPPDFFYYTDHRGWFLDGKWLSIGELESLRQRGAQYVIARDAQGTRARQPDVVRYLDESFHRLPIPNGYGVWDLTLPSAASAGRVAG